jgi:hypothetical protein
MGDVSHRVPPRDLCILQIYKLIGHHRILVCKLEKWSELSSLTVPNLCKGLFIFYTKIKLVHADGNSNIGSVFYFFSRITIVENMIVKNIQAVQTAYASFTIDDKLSVFPSKISLKAATLFVTGK